MCVSLLDLPLQDNLHNIWWVITAHLQWVFIQIQHIWKEMLIHNVSWYILLLNIATLHHIPSLYPLVWQLRSHICSVNVLHYLFYILAGVLNLEGDHGSCGQSLLEVCTQECLYKALTPQRKWVNSHCELLHAFLLTFCYFVI